MEIRLLRCVFSLCSTLGSTHALSAENCIAALTASITNSADVSSCDLLSTVDGKAVTVLAGKDAFVRSQKGNLTTFYRIDMTARSVEVKILESSPWLAEIRGAQTLPDAKSFYFPFFLSLKNEVTGELGSEPAFSCVSSKSFSARGPLAC